MHYIVYNCWVLSVEDMRLCPCILNTGHPLQQNCLTLSLICWFFVTVQVEAALVAGGQSQSHHLLLLMPVCTFLTQLLLFKVSSTQI